MSDRPENVEQYGCPVDQASVIVVAVHGRRQDPTFVIEHLARPAQRPATAWLLPRSPSRSWYPHPHSAPILDNQPHLDEALAAVDDATQHALTHRPPSQILLVGFSQGACLISEYAARNPHNWGALAILTGSRMGPVPDEALRPVDTWPEDPPDHRGPRRVYTSTAAHDPWMDVARLIATADYFTECGADVVVEIFPDDQHMIRPADVAHLRLLVDKLDMTWHR